MYLKSLSIKNFRKFNGGENVVEFVQSLSSKKIDSANRIAGSTTLIVGKNNSGKTSISAALNLILNNKNLMGHDFNYRYLKEFIERYSQDSSFKETPILEFKLIVSVDFSNASEDVSTKNISEFITIDTVEDELDVSLIIRYEVLEQYEFLLKVKKIIKNKDDLGGEKVVLRKFIELIGKTKFSSNYYDENNNRKTGTIKVGDLIDYKEISANRKQTDDSLSAIFNKIVKYRYGLPSQEENREKLELKISNINNDITGQVGDTHEKSVNDVLGGIVSNEKVGVNLRSDLDFESLLKNLIRYEFFESGEVVPQSNFGLGYSSLMSILGEIIDYVEQYSDEDMPSKVNLICIEEPETYMHPQMQELFIKYINDAISILLGKTSKKINSQLIITTHSSHILNSKIHHSNSFNNINYLASMNGFSHIVKLSDSIIKEGSITVPEDKNKDEKVKENDLKFLKKHIKYKVSELFFSDAVIFVEGVTEETLLNYYIDSIANLNKNYISIFNINGAHAHIYYPLIKILKVPCLVITDLDIKRSDEEKFIVVDVGGKNKKIPIYTQVSSLASRKTTNQVLNTFSIKANETLESVVNYYEDENLKIVFQKDSIEGFYASSFEEAFILSNYSNQILNSVLESVKPEIYNDIVGPEKNNSLLMSSSYELQKKLSNDKSNFANSMLYEMAISEEINHPVLPKYIVDGLNWLGVMIAPPGINPELIDLSAVNPEVV